MDYFLYRCSGTTFCHYTKRFQRACVSFLAYYNLLPANIRNLTVHEVKNKMLFPGVTRRTRGVRNASLVVSRPGFLHQSVRFCHTQLEGRIPRETTVALPAPVVKYLGSLDEDIHSSITEMDPDGVNQSELATLARYSFQQGGKLFRPETVLLMSGACGSCAQSESEILRKQYKIAVVSEMIHTASLIHDDVIDEADKRRNKPTVNALWGNRKAILIGDYVLAKATQLLCTIGDADVIRLLAQVIEDLVKGEFMQMGARETAEARFLHYMSKTFKKTASLFAHSCQAVALLTIPRCPPEVEKAAHEYGRNLGLAFQLIDDLLDFVAQSSSIGKPVVADLKLGLATAPVLFAAKQHSELEKLIRRRFSERGDVEKAWELVMKSDGILRTRQLAETHCKEAVRQAKNFPDTVYSRALCHNATKQLNREK